VTAIIGENFTSLDPSSRREVSPPLRRKSTAFEDQTLVQGD